LTLRTSLQTLYTTTPEHKQKHKSRQVERRGVRRKQNIDEKNENEKPTEGIR